jgi:hypothetical protein
MNDHFQLRIEEIFFPVQELVTNPDHTSADGAAGTRINNHFNIGSTQEDPSRIIAELTVETDRNTSVNPPYFFRLHTRAIFKIEGEFQGEFAEKRATRIAFDIVVGAARERVLELSSRNSLGRFMLPVIQMSTPD